jgi:hypothetical protein
MKMKLDMEKHLTLDCYLTNKEEIKTKEDTKLTVLTKKGFSGILADLFYKTGKITRIEEETISKNTIPQVKDKGYEEDSDFESKEFILIYIESLKRKSVKRLRK